MKLFKHDRSATRSRSVAKPASGLLLLAALGLALAFVSSARSAQATVDLGDAESFGALSFTAMTNAGADTVVNGNIGSSTSIGAGVTHPGFAAYGAGSSQLADAQASLLTAYDFAAAQAPTGSITGDNLAGDTLLPGVYNSSSTILISGPIPLTLDGNGDPNSVFIFQAGSDLTVDPTSSIAYTNGAQPCNVFWKVNSAFLKNTGGTFVGTILALTQITLTENITVEGRVLARNADVTFIHDTINKPSCAAPVATTAPATTTATTAGTTAATTTTAAATPTTATSTPTTGTSTPTPAATTPQTSTTPTSNRPVPTAVATAAKDKEAAAAKKAASSETGFAKRARVRVALTC
jgi:hypothetical protein